MNLQLVVCGPLSVYYWEFRPTASIPRENTNSDGKEDKGNWGDKIAPVGSFAPDGYGLSDMAGNVFE